jgi:hypothetical protein
VVTGALLDASLALVAALAGPMLRGFHDAGEEGRLFESEALDRDALDACPVWRFPSRDWADLLPRAGGLGNSMTSRAMCHFRSSRELSSLRVVEG